MTSVQFAYWLQGLFELGNPKTLDAKQTDLIKRHLAMVFKHEIDPSYGDEQHQAELHQLHSGGESHGPFVEGTGSVFTATQSSTVEATNANGPFLPIRGFTDIHRPDASGITYKC